MNKKIILPVFLFEAVFCLFLALCPFSSGDIFTTIVTFPFIQVGTGLRRLSLSGGFGNILAIIGYVLFSLIPCVIILLFKKKRKLVLEDALLIVLSVLLFAVLYLLINPGLLPNLYTGLDAVPAKTMMSVTVYSVLSAYIVLRLLRLFFTSQIAILHKYMKSLLFILNAIFVYLLFGAAVSQLIHSFNALQEANVGNEHLLGTSYLFLILGFIVDNIPIAFNIAVVFSGISLLNALVKNQYSQEAAAGARHLSRLSKLSLTTIILSNAVFNILQLLFATKLNIMNSTVQIPVFSILFVLAVLLLARLVSDNRTLKEDNDSII